MCLCVDDDMSSSSCHKTVVFHLTTKDFAVSLNFEMSSKVYEGVVKGALQPVCGVFCYETTFACCVSIEVFPFLLLVLATCVLCSLHVIC